MKRFYPLVMASLIAGCAVKPSPSALPNYSAPGNFAAAKNFLTSGKTILSTRLRDRPTAYLILDKSNPGRNEKMCKAFSLLPSMADARDANPNAKVVSTWWFLGTAEKSSDDCKWLVKNYGYERANAWRSQLPAKPGQYLLAIDQKNRSFYIDLTKANRNQRETAMLRWFQIANAGSTAGPGIELVSDNMFDQMARGLCGTAIKDVTVERVFDAALDLSPTQGGRIVIDLAGKFVCERFV